MPDRRGFSKTMRIDLIPDVPNQPVAGKQRVVIARAAQPAARRAPAAEESPQGGTTRYQELLQSVYDAAVIADSEGGIVDVNVRAVEFFYYSPDEFCGLTVFDIISGADASLIETLWKNLENERFTLIQAYCLRKDGTYFPSEIAVNKLRLGTMHLCFFIRDITLRKQAEEMLITEHNAIRNASNGIAVVGLDCRVEYANPAVAGMWRLGGSESLIGRDVRDLFDNRAAADAMVAAVMGDGTTWVGDTVGRRPDATQFDLQVSATCNRNSEGETVGVVFSFADASDRKRAESAEREAERRRVMLESLGAACHHLGQPATILLANLGVIRSQLRGSSEDVRGVVESSIEAGERLGRILHKLNAVNEYKTMQYLENPDGSESGNSRILDI